MGEKPDFKQVKNLLRETAAIDSTMKAALDGQKPEITEVRRAAESFYRERFKAELEAMDVELLSQGKQGVRVSSLRAAGINNLFQLSELSVPRLEALDGIG